MDRRQVHAKEKTGIERAQLAIAFARDRYTEWPARGGVRTDRHVRQLLSRLLRRRAAPRPVGELLREKMRSDVATAVAEMERVALSKREGSFGIDPTAWFVTITLKMDFLVEFESAVRASLTPGRV